MGGSLGGSGFPYCRYFGMVERMRVDWGVLGGAEDGDELCFFGTDFTDLGRGRIVFNFGMNKRL